MEMVVDGPFVIRASSFLSHSPMSTTQTTSSLAVVILGAGASSRMGRPKLLLPWQGSTVIGHLISQWRELGAAQIAVVLRPDDLALAKELDRLGFPKQDRITNPQPERGMFSSIVCAANWRGWRGEISHWAIALGDQPHLQRETLRQLLDVSALNSDAVCQPAFAGRTAHPVILPRPVFEALKSSAAATLKDFLKLAPGRSVQPIINDPGLALDLDTPEDYIQGEKLTKAK
jgi:molybdenum cofactor cytidylyltransferase